LIPNLAVKTRLVLIVHAKELKRTTNTGRLAVQALSNSEMRIRGGSKQALDLGDLLNGPYRTLLFYPSDNAVELRSQIMINDPRPIQLLVPDGNWRQASKVHYRHEELKDVPRVMIREENLASSHLRAESTSYGMATLEAIAKAFYLLEGPEVGEQLMALFQAKLEQTMASRGVPPSAIVK
jgi:DTW domain-containing protein YfiP